MGHIYKGMEELIGKTPLLEILRIEQKEGLKARVLVKLEQYNPAGSVKDRAALSMVLDAEEKGLLKPGAVIVEPTSGNTGIALAAIAAARGYRAVFTMPETMSIERRKLLAGYGASIVLTDGKKGMAGAIERAKELVKEQEHAVLLGQFENPANPAAHFNTTGPELWEDAGGHIDLLVAGAGTGGTLSGTGAYLKSKNPDIRIVAVEPADSPVLSGGTKGAHGLQGIGAGFVPETLDTDIYDEVAVVKTEEAYKAVRLLAETEGILAGISSGAALHSALCLARKESYTGKVIVVILPDTGERYLSTALFEQ